MARVGLISDTHGLLRREARECLAGCDFIIHAGDVGEPSILERLGEIAPVTAVRGNIDKGHWADALPVTEVLEVEGKLFYVLHALEDLDLDPVAAGIHAVISGHSHRPAIDTRGSVLYVNPGSAGPRRFSLPICVGRIKVTRTGLEPEIVRLSVSSNA
jgi:uncharacterized protein